MARKDQVKKLHFKQKLLSRGRPPSASQPSSMSKKATQKIIRTQHQLNKQLKMAENKGDEEQAAELKQRMNDLGGMKAYQQASKLGQAKDRGGDTSEVLMEWLQDIKPTLSSLKSKIRMLEIGSLSTKNACSTSGLFEIERIDLFSEDDAILQQDFMERPLPKFEKDQFDIISLSLVLNFLPSAVDRGDMLKRTCQFLHTRVPKAMPEKLRDKFPALFMVVPASCITKSRYMNEERLILLMASLGYILLNRKQSKALLYYLWVLRDRPEEQKFVKTEVNPGGGRNNFSIVLDG